MCVSELAGGRPERERERARNTVNWQAIVVDERTAVLNLPGKSQMKAPK